MAHPPKPWERGYTAPLDTQRLLGGETVGLPVSKDMEGKSIWDQVIERRESIPTVSVDAGSVFRLSSLEHDDAFVGAHPHDQRIEPQPYKYGQTYIEGDKLMLNGQVIGRGKFHKLKREM